MVLTSNGTKNNGRRDIVHKKVSIVMATYNPNMMYLEEQLKSIENQSYRNIELFICDDCSTEEKYSEILNLANKVLKNTAYSIIQNESNMGSNRTFEKLTMMATGEYIAYSDQDDQFDRDKIQVLVDLLENEGSILAYSDARVIDGEGKVISESFKRFAKRVEHTYGNDQTSFFIRRNSVTGCTMLIRSDAAKDALPFPDYKIYVHDQWITLLASTKGKISYSERPLISYRIHGGNQIGSSLLKQVEDKETYLKNKLIDEKARYEFLTENSKYFSIEQRREINDYLLDSQCRINFFQHTNVSSFIFLLKNRKIDFQLFGFEVLIATLPKFAQRKMIKMIKGG